MTVLELESESRVSDGQYVSMSTRQVDELLTAVTEQRRRYLELLRSKARDARPPIMFPVRPVIGRGQVERAPDEVSAIVPPYNRPRRSR